MAQLGPVLSIGMPVYNGERFIADALNSILAQSFANFELLIIDNASTDLTSEICKDFCARDSRISYIRNPENIGAVLNFRKVFEVSSGEFFMWAAADDVWDPHWVSTLLKYTEKSVGVAFGQVVFVDFFGEIFPHIASKRDLSFLGSRISRRVKFALSPPINGKANLIYSVWRRDILFKTLQAYPLQNEHGADIIFCYHALQHSEISCDPTVSIFKRNSLIEQSKAQNSSLLEKIRSISDFDITLSCLRYSSGVERFIILVFLPWVLIRNSIQSIRNR